jgi:hypothetical protein
VLVVFGMDKMLVGEIKELLDTKFKLHAKVCFFVCWYCQILAHPQFVFHVTAEKEERKKEEENN